MSLKTSSLDKNFPADSLYSLRLKEWSRQIPLIRLSAKWEKSILELIPSRMKQRHPRRVEKTLMEIRKIYENDMRDCATNSIIPGWEFVVDDRTKEFDPRAREKIKNSCSVPKQRALFSKKYFLSHTIVKHIIETASKLPRLIIEIKNYRHIDFYEFSELHEALISDIDGAAAIIRNDYYGEIVKFISNHLKRRDENFENERIMKLMNCATNLFAQQIIRVMMSTMDELTEALTDYRHRCPQLNIRLVWSEGRLSTDPTVDQIHSLWHNLANSIEKIAENLSTFDQARITSGKVETVATGRRIKVALPDWYMQTSHSRVDEALRRAVGPLDRYFETIVKHFGEVSSPSTKQKILDLVSKDRHFDVYCSNVKDLTCYHEKANELVDSLYYDVGRLDQREAKMRLRCHISDVRGILIDKLLLHHREHNEEICQEFQRLEDEMLDIPVNAKALFGLSEKISYASKVLVGTLEERVRTSIEMLSSLLELTNDMSESHMELNSKTINWLGEIMPVFVKSNNLCEAMKSELEDELQREINNLNMKIEAVVPQFVILDDMDDGTRVEEYVEHLAVLVGYVDELDSQVKQINFEERLFKFPETSFPNVEEIRDILMPVYSLNNIMCEWRRDHAVWLDGPFEYIDAREVRTKTLGYHERFDQLNTSLKAKIKVDMQSSANKPFKYSGVVDDPDPMQQPAPLKLCWQVLEDVKSFEQRLELIDCVCNPALRERHWEEMALIRELGGGDRGGLRFTPNAGTTLRKLIALDLQKDIEKYQIVSVGANKEIALARKLQDMVTQWDNMDFTIVASGAAPGTLTPPRGPPLSTEQLSTFAYSHDIQILMEEHSIVIQEMKVSYFVKPILSELVELSTALVRVGDMMQKFLGIQDEWFDLEQVFRTGVVPQRTWRHKKMAEASEIFFVVNEAIEIVKKKIMDEPKFRSISKTSSQCLQLLDAASEKLEIVKESVRGYIQELRNLFPRLYFLYDREVVKIVFERSFSMKMKMLLKKCFSDIRSLRISKDSQGRASVVGIIDNHDQQLSLKTSMISEPPMEIHDESISSFIAVQKSIINAVKESIVQCSDSLNLSCESIVQRISHQKKISLREDTIAMALLCSWRIYWVRKVEEAFQSPRPATLLASVQDEQSCMLKSLIADLKHEWSRKQRKKIVSLIIQIRDQQDITGLVSTTAKGPQDFHWKSQIRHYFQNNDIKVVILNTESSYGYEYSACEKPLINTALTDRCHRSLMEAHRNGLHGLLFGPTAVGKTQCIKDLARMLAIRLYIYNCHENVLNYRHIDNVFRGLLGCSPCWLFFKHLDLLTIQMQSVFAQQISKVFENTVAGSTAPEMVDVQGTTNNSTGLRSCFITGTISTKYPKKSHAQDLTDSLKILFRPVAMTLPDIRRIIEVELFAEGFVNAAMFAEKIQLIEGYSRDQLSLEISACDFSIRSTKSVVQTACALKNRYPNEAEEALILRALVDVHLPKISRPSDILAFQNLIEDVFPGVVLPSPNYMTLLSALDTVQRDKWSMKSCSNRLYSLKIIQLFEMLFVRHAIVVVGSPLSGKTSVIDTLGQTLSLLNKGSLNNSPFNHEEADVLPRVESVRINHTALALEEIFGWYENNSGQTKPRWKDGIFTRVFRSFSEGEKKLPCSMQWLILDGPLDESIFIDKLDTLLDENKIVFLPSGERISISDSTSILIETMSLKKASPATISRCGTIYIGEATIGWEGLVSGWIIELQSLLPTRNDDDRDYKSNYAIFLKSVLEWSLGRCLEFAYNRLSAIVRPLTNKSHLVTSVLKILEMYLRDALGETARISIEANVRGGTSEPPKWTIGNLYIWTQAALLMAIVWGFGCILDCSSRVRLDEFCTSTWRTGTDGSEPPRPEILKSFEISLPTQGLIEDHTYVFSGTGNWRPWSDVLKKSGRVLNGPESSLKNWQLSQTNHIPTIESVKYLHILELHVKYRKPFILLGEMASGKTLYMRHLLKSKLCQSTCLSNFLSLGFAGSRYNSGRAQKMLLSKLTKLKRGTYGLGEGRVCVNFIDDLNVILDSKNARDQAVLELVRQYHDSSQWYDAESGGKIYLRDVMFAGAMTLDCSSEWNDEWREPRFFRHFNLYNVDKPSTDSIFRIYSNILLANLRSNQFNADVSGSVNSMVNATIDVYSSLCQTLRPVPSKFQYRFTLRDVNRVITGCSSIQKDSVETKVTFIRLWVHEALRVFADRIVDVEDSTFLYQQIKESVGAHFKETFESAFDHLPKNGDDQLTIESFHHLIFSDFMQLDVDVEAVQKQQNDSATNNDSSINNNKKRRYEEITCSKEALKNKAVSYLNRYNDSEPDARKKLDMLILPNILEHLIKICRILSTPGGSLLMLCFGGSGRRTLSALASYLKGHPFHELSRPVVSGAVEPWRRDLKRACTSCIAGTRPSVATDCTFFITDRQIYEAPPSLLRDICSLMKTGQIPDLFETDEKDSIVERSRLLAQNGDRNLEMNSLDVIDYFYKKCQEKLHFVLYYERRRYRTKEARFGPSFSDSIFNSIVSECSIDCYESWPEESFSEIATTFMKDIDVDKDVKFNAISASKYFYDTVESWTRRGSNDDDSPETERCPKLPVAAYLHMVRLYSVLMTKKQNEIKASRKRYLGGLEKLQLAAEEVREMKSILTRLRPELEQSAKETAETMKKIERENVSVENATIQVKREEQVANGIAKVAGILKEECEADLAVAIPILEDAIAALNTLKPTDITLVKAMKNPPDTVKLVLAAVCVMLNVPPDRSVDPVTGKKSIDYWAPSKRILGDMNFLQNLKDYDKDNIAPSVMTIINKTYMNDETFMPHIVAKASSAAEGLCKWVRAMVSYDEVAKVVAPKKEKLAGAERECNASVEYLNEKRKSLAALNDKLAALNVVLEATLAKKVQLEKQVANCTTKLAKAEGLITSLAGEKAKWLKSADELRQSYDCLAGDLLLSCGLVALLGTFDAIHREMHIAEWKNQLRRLRIPSSGTAYDFVSSLETEIEVNDWKQAGLSNNAFSKGNAAIMKNSLLWPIFIDPGNQANSWIRRIEASNKIVVIKATDPDWIEEIDKCVKDDVPVLLENLERTNYLRSTVLDYILCRVCPRLNCSKDLQANHASGTTPASLQQRGYFQNFRFYVTIRVSLHEATLEPHIYKKMSVINFSLADEALEDRLLEIVVSREKPELNDKFDKLMASSANNKRVLKEEEDKILAILSGSSSVNIIEDERAIETLDDSKNLSLEIMKREEAARVANREMDEFRAAYRSLTNYCAALYNTVSSIATLNHMYRFSLDWFTRLYVRSIDQSMKSVVLDKRLRYLKSSFTEILHSSVRNALLDEHKLVYSFLLTIKILLDSKKITQEELRLFKDTSLFHTQQNFESIKNISINYRITAIEKLSKALPLVFNDLPKHYLENRKIWDDYCDGTENPSFLPGPWNTLSEFQKLILANIMKPGKTLPMIISLVENSLETSLSSLATYNVARCFEESSCLIPLIFILPSYMQASGIVRKWAKTTGYSSKVLSFTMGAIDESTATRIDDSIDKARQQGGWILLENCHLATDHWLAKLEKICEGLDPSNTVLSFRLWLTSYPTHRFPISILQIGIKIHWEAPCDKLKQSLLSSYQSEPLDNPDFYNSCPGKNKTFSKLVYTLCFFHAVIRGRCKFQNRAWNFPYEFTDSDLKISIGQLQNFLNNSDEQVPTNFETLTYLIGECYYGGKILNPIDRGRLNTILRDYCNPRIVRATSDYVLAVDNEDGHEVRYFVPNRTEYRDFMKHINNSILEGETRPEIFGLDNNVSIVRDAKNAAEFNQALGVLFADNLLANDCNNYADVTHDSAIPSSCRNNICYFKIGLQGYIDRNLEEIIEAIRAKLLPQKDDKKIFLDIGVAKNKYILSYAEPLNALLIEEVELYNNLIEIIRDSLVDVERTCNQGLAPLFSTSTAVEEGIQDLIKNQIPFAWTVIDNKTGPKRARTLPQFIDHLTKRREFLNNWMTMGHRGSFWLGGMVRCRKFVSASRLTIARQCGLRLSDLEIEYEVLKVMSNDSKPWESVDVDVLRGATDFADSSVNVKSAKRTDVKVAAVHIHGLFLSGARWDIERSTLVRGSPKLCWDAMPVIRFGSRSDKNDNKLDQRRCDNYYPCPVSVRNTMATEGMNFLRPLANDYVTTVPLGTKDFSPDYWTKRATTLCCNKDD